MRKSQSWAAIIHSVHAERPVHAASRLGGVDNFELYFRETFAQIAAYERGATLRLANPNVTPRRA